MSVSIKYKGNTIASASTEVTKTIKTAGKYCEADILVENTPDSGADPVINPLSVTANGTYTAPSGVDGYSPVTVNVPQGITPSGKKLITDTSETDVAAFATAQVSSDTLLAENIKKNVNILGVVGSFEGGGGLPSSISKIDGGSFTPSADVTDYWISHNLGVEPKGVMVWATARPTCANHNCTSFFQMGISQVVTGNANIGFYFGNKLWTEQPTTQSNMTGNFTESNKNKYFDGTTRFKWWTDSIYYEAGIEYKWLAWA